MHDNKDVEGNVSDNIAGKYVQWLNLVNNENENENLHICYRSKLFIGYSIFKLVYFFKPGQFVST